MVASWPTQDHCFESAETNARCPPTTTEKVSFLRTTLNCFLRFQWCNVDAWGDQNIETTPLRHVNGLLAVFNHNASHVSVEPGANDGHKHHAGAKLVICGARQLLGLEAKGLPGENLRVNPPCFLQRLSELHGLAWALVVLVSWYLLQRRLVELCRTGSGPEE